MAASSGGSSPDALHPAPEGHQRLALVAGVGLRVAGHQRRQGEAHRCRSAHRQYESGGNFTVCSHAGKLATFAERTPASLMAYTY